MTVRLACLAPRPMATVRLLCCPFAGGGVGAFRPWARLLPAPIEAFVVQLPGREERLRDPAFPAWEPMFAAVREAAAKLPPLPTVIFGHSLGAVIGLELARWMEAERPGELRHCFAAARPWPGAPTGERGALHGLSDEELLAVLDRQYGSLSSSSLAHPEIRELLLPVLRADLRLLETYRYAPGAPLSCGLTVHAGRDDPGTPPELLQGWARETRGAFEVRWLDAAHFFVESHREALVGDIARKALPVA